MRNYLLGIGLSMLALNASAAIINTSGNVSIISPPLSLGEGEVSSDVDVFVFAERQQFMLPTNVLVNAILPGTYTAPTNPATEFVPVNSVIDSYLLHFDPISDEGVRITGLLNFDFQIVGLVFGSNELLGSSPVLGVSTTTYFNTGIEEYMDDINPPIGDLLTLSPDHLSLSFDLRATTSTDDVRIITSANTVPIPSAVWLFGSGLLGLIGVARIKKV